MDIARRNKVMDQIAEIKTLMALAAGKMKLLNLSVKEPEKYGDLQRDKIKDLIKKFVPEAQYFLLNKRDKEKIDTRINTMLRLEEVSGNKKENEPAFFPISRGGN